MLTPPQTYEVLPAAQALLQDTGIVAAMGGFGVVVVAEGDVLDVPWPNPAANGFRWRAVLMNKINGLAAPPEHTDKVRGFPLRLRIDVEPPQEAGFDAVHFLEGAHQKAYQALHMKAVDIDKAALVYRIIRRTVPTPTFREETQGWRFMSAEYLTVLGPT